jgi:lipopolysaccharide export system permease protein
VQLEFFPSRTMTLYIAKMFAVRVVAVLLMLVMVLQALDLLSESGDILAVHGNGQAQLLTYVGLRAPSWWRASCPIRCCWPRSSP